MDFAKKSDEYLKLDDYTQSTVESFARSFEAFVSDKLKPTGKECNLVCSSYDSDFYPQGEMKNKLNSLWEQMWPQIKKGIDKAIPVNPDIKLEKSFIMNNIKKFRDKFMQDKNQNNNGLKYN